MGKNRYDNAIFDVDGTLFDSYPSVSACVKHAYETMNTPPPSDAVLRTFLGPSLHDSFSEYTDWSDPEIDRAVGAYREKYAGGAYREAEFYPGMRELLERLASDGVRLTIASSKPYDVLIKVLEHKDALKFFEKIAAPDFAHKGSDKEALIRAAAVGRNPVMIGDRKYDVEGAVKAGVHSIGAAFGFGGRDELAAAGATYLADTAEEIYKIITGDTI